jgi:predicted nuclease of predicted toxin-antitoxin system
MGTIVWYIAELAPGVDDEEVLQRSRDLRAILLTADKDFGELVFRQHRRLSGIVLIRLAGLHPQTKAELVATAFDRHASELEQGFAVLSKRALRLRKRSL